MKNITPCLQLLRPKHWVKNSFVFAPLLFSGEFIHTGMIAKACLASVYFCFAASAVYIMNDINDIESDRANPSKQIKRPLASGAISVKTALVFLLFLYIVIGTGFYFFITPMLAIIGYIVLNIAYTFKLKKIPVIDIFCIAFGFVLRIYAGSLAIGTPMSGWMLISVLCLALYLAAIKRRQELGKHGTEGREVLNFYSVYLIEKYAEISSTGAIVFYSMFVMTSKPEMIVTIPLVLFGVFRYWYVVEQKEAGESPTDVLMHDLPMLLTVLAWGATCLWNLLPEGLL